MTYTLSISGAAEKDLADTIDYIENTLKNEEAAYDLLNETNEKFTALISFPYQYALCNDAILSSWGIRHIQIKTILRFIKFRKKKIKLYWFAFFTPKEIGKKF